MTSESWSTRLLPGRHLSANRALWGSARMTDRPSVGLPLRGDWGVGKLGQSGPAKDKTRGKQEETDHCPPAFFACFSSFFFPALPICRETKTLLLGEIWPAFALQLP